MKKEFLLFSMFLVLLFGPLTHAAFAEEKKVCEKVVDAKTKKEKEVCKVIKIHKKLDGTTMPGK